MGWHLGVMKAQVGFGLHLGKYLYFVCLFLSSYRFCEQSDIKARVHFSTEGKEVE